MEISWNSAENTYVYAAAFSHTYERKIVVSFNRVCRESDYVTRNIIISHR